MPKSKARLERRNPRTRTTTPHAAGSETAARIHRALPTIFAGLGLVMGLLYAFILPPLQAPDEMMHFARTYSVSQGTCVASPDIDIPQSFAELDELFPHWLERYRQISVADLRAALKTPLNDGVMAGHGRERALDGFINQNLYTCLPYVPAGVALNAGRRLGLSPLGLMYLVRITNLLVYLALTFWALRLLPDFRWVLVSVALMPMALHQAASASADATGFAAMFLLSAYVLRLALADPPVPIGLRQWAAMASLLLFTALSRSLLAVVELPLVISAERFGSSRRRWIGFATCALLTIATVGLWQQLNHANVDRLVEERLARPAKSLRAVDVPANEAFLYQHPLVAASIFARSVARPDFIAFASAQMVGRLGWLSVPLPAWLVWMYIALLVAAAATQTRGTQMSWRARAVSAVFVAAGIVNTLAAGWILETPQVVLRTPAVWDQFAVYTQGRYWIPLAFPALLLLTTSKLRINPRMFAPIAIVIILLATGTALAAIEALYYR